MTKRELALKRHTLNALLFYGAGVQSRLELFGLMVEQAARDQHIPLEFYARMKDMIALADAHTTNLARELRDVILELESAAKADSAQDAR